jgi:peptidoglycan/xylan/chitin deacetylase (PgdA/CDA1 family)
VSIWLLYYLLLNFIQPAQAESNGTKQLELNSPPKETESCGAEITLDRQMNDLVNNVFLFSTWVNQPQEGLKTLTGKFGPYVFAYVNRSPWPYIHEQAKLAKVPVMMYHDILPKKEVFFDVTPEELEAHFQLIKEQGLTPINVEQLMTHLQTGLPLPEKPILLTFDDGYEGHYTYVYPLMKKYGYPAVFSIYTKGVGNNVGRRHVTWEHLQEMVADPLVTIASHSVTHPLDLTKLPDDQLIPEVRESKRILEEKLNTNIRYFTYPVGKYDQRVAQLVQAAGYQLAFTMDDNNERFAGASESLLAVARIGQSRTQEAIAQAWGGAKSAFWNPGFNFSSPIKKTPILINKIPLVLISGGKPITIHADSRYLLTEILAKSRTPAIAAVDGTFFSLKYLDSNQIIGPVLNQVNNQFIPGDRNDIPKLAGRPLVLINPSSVRYIPFDPALHNTLEGIQTEMPDVTDAFVAGAWLVKDGQPATKESFNNLYGADIPRYRAFWGINTNGEPTIGASRESVDAESLGKMLAQLGLRDAVMLDSGNSTSLVYKGESLVAHEARPIPHAVALIPTSPDEGSCD